MILKLNNLGESTANELQQLANQLNVHIDNILDFRGIRAPLGNGSYIISQRLDPGVGHWVCMCNNEYFDSMGIGPPRILGAKKYNDKQYQGSYDNYCGLWSMLYLYSKQHNRPDLLRNFYDLNTEISLR
jgi:hypothetical protein